MISFDVDYNRETSIYEAEEGMTFEQFINSSYNDGKFTERGSAIVYDNVLLYLHSNGTGLVVTSTVIEPNYSYYAREGGQ